MYIYKYVYMYIRVNTIYFYAKEVPGGSNHLISFYSEFLFSYSKILSENTEIFKENKEAVSNSLDKTTVFIM